MYFGNIAMQKIVVWGVYLHINQIRVKLAFDWLLKLDLKVAGIKLEKSCFQKTIS